MWGRDQPGQGTGGGGQGWQGRAELGTRGLLLGFSPTFPALGPCGGQSPLGLGLSQFDGLGFREGLCSRGLAGVGQAIFAGPAGGAWEDVL